MPYSAWSWNSKRRGNNLVLRGYQICLYKGTILYQHTVAVVKMQKLGTFQIRIPNFPRQPNSPRQWCSSWWQCVTLWLFHGAVHVTAAQLPHWKQAWCTFWSNSLYRKPCHLKQGQLSPIQVLILLWSCSTPCFSLNLCCIIVLCTRKQFLLLLIICSRWDIKIQNYREKILDLVLILFHRSVTTVNMHENSFSDLVPFFFRKKKRGNRVPGCKCEFTRGRLTKNFLNCMSTWEQSFISIVHSFFFLHRWIAYL